MMNREQLKQAGLRAYELGRLRSAARAVWLLVPLCLACAFETGARERCGCIGLLLIAAAIYLRWRSRRGAESVRNGLIASALPLVVGMVVARVAPSCAGAPLLSLCTAVCLAVALPSGVWLGLRTARGAAAPSTWFMAAGISVLAASLGCAGLGIAAILGVAVGLLSGGASAFLVAKPTQ